MLHEPLSARQTRLGFAPVVAVMVIAFLAGAVGGLVGWEVQLLLFSVALPAVLLLVDYRSGLLLAVLLVPYTNSKLVPSAGPLTVQNILLLGVTASFIAHWVFARARGRLVVVPLPRELIWYYLVPLTISAGIGSLHLSEISAHYLAANEMLSYGLGQYWISAYLKQLLLVAIACLIGAAVVEHGKGAVFAVTVVVSGVLLAFAVAGVVIATGATLQQLQNVRDLLAVIGRHNNEAGILLLGAIAPALFMRERMRHRLARFALLLSICIMVAGLVLTMSRGSFLGLLVVLAFYLWRQRRPGLVIAVLALATAGFASMPDAIRERLLLGLTNAPSVQAQLAGSVARDKLTQGRIWIWRQVAPEVLNSPFVGRGMLSTQWSAAAKSGVYYSNHPHSLYLEMLMDLGIVGVIFIVLFWRYLWRLFRRLAEDERIPAPMRGYFLGSAAGLLGVLAYGFANGHWFPAVEQLFVWTSIGLAFGYQRWLALQPAASPIGSRPTSGLRRFSLPDSAVLGRR